MTRNHRSFLSRMKANGAFTDSLNAYFHRSVGLAALRQIPFALARKARWDVTGRVEERPPHPASSTSTMSSTDVRFAVTERERTRPIRSRR